MRQGRVWQVPIGSSHGRGSSCRRSSTWPWPWAGTMAALPWHGDLLLAWGCLVEKPGGAHGPGAPSQWGEVRLRVLPASLQACVLILTPSTARTHGDLLLWLHACPFPIGLFHRLPQSPHNRVLPLGSTLPLTVRSSCRELQNAPDAIPESGVEPPPLDTAWVEATRKKALLKLEKLDTDLKNYKGNSIKESIRCARGAGTGVWGCVPVCAHSPVCRRGHDDLGDHYLDCGDLSNALKCYSRARDYCTSAKHVINMCLNVIKVSVYLQNWSHVLSYVSKAESTPEIAEVTHPQEP